LFQIGDERHAGAVDLLSFQADAFFNSAMMVPILVVKLNETDATFGEAPREQTI
jgi:hypothetical protein